MMEECEYCHRATADGVISLAPRPHLTENEDGLIYYHCCLPCAQKRLIRETREFRTPKGLVMYLQTALFEHIDTEGAFDDIEDMLREEL